ncbi:MFS transporter [Bacillus wiedmannii]|uniref:MFS transporter n=1 Tax=Bacillus wiedmannii TaxID=1890302 RepID=UPI00159BDCC3|nr:MFS transporter [Bacillus wiedmannii]
MKNFFNHHEFANLHSNVKVRLFLNFISRLHTSSLTILLPIFFSKSTTKSITAIIVAIVLGAGIIGRIVAGTLGDKYSRKKLIISSNSIEIIIFILLFLQLNWNVNNIFILGLLFSLNGFLSAMKGPLFESLLLDTLEPHNKKFVYSINYWLGNLSISLSFVLAGFIFNGRLELIVLFGLFCHLFSIWIVNKHVKEEAIIRNKTLSNNTFGGYKSVLQDYKFVLFCIGFFLIMGVGAQLSNYIAIYLNDTYEEIILTYYLDGIKLLSIIQILNTILVVLIPICFPKLLMLKGISSFIFGTMLYSIGYSGLLLVNNFIGFILCTVIYTLGELLYYPFRQTILADLVQRENQTKYMALNQIILQASRVLGAAGIVIFSLLNKYVVSLCIVFLGLIGGLIIVYIHNSLNIRKSKELRNKTS